jgi:hypothetical protein
VFYRNDEMIAEKEPVGLTDYSMVTAFISGGLGMGALAQALRLLLEINHRLEKPQTPRGRLSA